MDRGDPTRKKVWNKQVDDKSVHPTTKAEEEAVEEDLGVRLTDRTFRFYGPP